MSSKDYFGKVAERWDEMRQEFFSEEVRNKAYEVAEVEVGKVAADIGAGTGFITEGLVMKGVKVIAVDQSEEMLSMMRNKFIELDNIEFRSGDAECLPLEDYEVDYVFANMFLHHVEDPSKAINEMVRILKPGGKLVITDLDIHEFEFLKTEQFDKWMGFNREDVKKWYLSAGLKDVIVYCVGTECCSGSSCDCKEAKISIFLAMGKKV